MSNRNSSLIALILGFLVLGVMPACNSVRGAGEDIESAGEAIADSAQEAEDDINE